MLFILESMKRLGLRTAARRLISRSSVEPQFNLADPFSRVWPKGFDTGMVLLRPGQSTAWSVIWRVFTI
jgi:hypothetical protein